MAKMLREYIACWVRHEPNLEVGTIQFVPSELPDVSVEIEEARKFDREASFSLIERFCTAVNTNSDIDDRLLRHIAKAMEVLIQDGEPDLTLFAQTLGIKYKKHRPRKNEKRDQEIFFAVREFKLRGMTNEDAYSEVAKARTLSAHTIESIYKERKINHLEFLREMDEDDEARSEALKAVRELLEEK